ncbi:MAG: response regulator, partial [Spirochaetales bacterium]
MGRHAAVSERVGRPEDTAVSETARVKANIVVIDDDKLVNDLIYRILRKEYNARGYESAEEALRSENLSAVDVIIADVNLPGM